MVLKLIQKIVSNQSSSIDKLPTEKPPLVKTPVSAKGFEELGLIEALTKAVAAEGYTSPTPIQVKSIPEILAGRDVLGSAQTGTGKTAAFALPMLQNLQKNNVQGHPLRALILAPTRELALQIRDSFVVYGKHLPLRSAVVFGGVGLEPQVKALRSGVDILVATPGRLLDLMGRRCVDFRSLEILVLDEADRMLDMGFINDIKRILKQVPQKRQNLLFSATMPKEVQGLVDSILHNPAKVEVAPVSSTSEQVLQRLYYVSRADKRQLLLHIMDNEAVTRGLVFTRTKHNANKLEDFLKDNGVPAAAIHGNKSQSARQKALESFREGKVQILVASDIAARGIDINEISHVINFELPPEAESYVHRIGRTGRAAASGVAISFCDVEERKLIAQIERVTKKKIPVIADHPFAKASQTEAPRPAERRGGQNQHRSRTGSGGGGGYGQRGGQNSRSGQGDRSGPGQGRSSYGGNRSRKPSGGGSTSQ